MPRGKPSPVGTVTVNVNGYSQTKTEDRGWVGTHTLVLEARLGRLLRGDERAIFKDGNKRNLTPENIELSKNSSMKSIKARIAKLQAEVDDRLAMIKDLESSLASEQV